MRSSSQNALAFSLLLLTLIFLPAQAAAAERTIVTSPDLDYFGFDLSTHSDVSLDQCKALCLEDEQCRAFTYTSKQEWCFLKSDHGIAKPFAGAIAGRVVDVSAQAELGAPPPLDFLPEHVTAEVHQTKREIGAPDAAEARGFFALRKAGDAGLLSGDVRVARDAYLGALRLDTDDAALWIGFARASLRVIPGPGENNYRLKQTASSAAQIAYRRSTTTAVRAEALAVLADALDKRSLFRPALEAYKASLSLLSSAEVRAAYKELRERQGFRVVGHSVDSDAATPRICVQFSESLVRSGTDYAQFVTVNGASAKSLEAKDKQVCVEWLSHGQTYRVGLRQGLPSSVGEVLEQPVALNVYVRDRAPSVRFTGDRFVLPSTTRRGIPLISVNTDSARLEAYRIGDRTLARLLSGSTFLRQLKGYEIDNIRQDLGSPVWQGSIDIASQLNKEVTTSFPVDEAIPDKKPGIYVLTAVPKDGQADNWQARATQWFVISDIGVTSFTGEDGLNVFVRSLASAKPIAKADVQLVARNNEVLGSVVSDENGRASFAAGLVRGKDAMAPAAVLVRRGSSDFVLLDLTRAGFDFADRGVAGRASPGAVDVFSWTERGIYRPGETVHASALVRDVSAHALGGLPLTFVFRRPDGVEDRRIVSAEDRLGGHMVDYELQDNAMRGTWSVRMHTDIKADPVAEMRFLVEDFVPDRLEFDLAASPPEIAVTQPATVAIDGRYLYGAPAAGLGVEGSVRIKTTRQWDAYPGYLFGLAEEQIQAVTRPLDAVPDLDAAGKAEVPVVLTGAPATTQLLAGSVVMRVREPGGRAVERDVDLKIRPERTVIGIRPDAGEAQVAENSTAGFRVITVEPDGGRAQVTGLKWRLIRLERNYQWYRSGDRWSYEAIDLTKQVADGQVDAPAQGEARISVPVAWGRYRLEVTDPRAGGAAASVDFNAGWVVTAASLDAPDGLEMALDKAAYAAGDKARLTISARHAGEVLVTVGTNQLSDVRTVSVDAGDTVVEFPVGADWGAGAYVTATLYRRGDAENSRLPSRAIGVKWLQVDPEPRKIDLALGAPDQVAARGQLEVPMTLTGLARGEQAFVTVAAVDVGILNLTRYETPDPAGWYFGQRRIGLDIRDIYGRLIDASLGVQGQIRSGGDAAGLASDGSPPTQKLLALFSGPVEVGADGKAAVSFDLPQFNGTIRLMAVAWSKHQVGNASQDVIVRDPVVLLATAPKVMAPGDTSRLRLDIANTDGPAGDYVVEVIAEDGLSAEQGLLPNIVTLADGGKASLSVPFSATGVGSGQVNVRLTHESGIDLAQTLYVPVRPAALPIARRQEMTLAANGGTIALDEKLLAGSQPDGALVTVDVSRTRGFNTASVLASLDRYPYGCTEQTTSRALPLLYLSDLPGDPKAEDESDVRTRVQKAIYRVLANQSSSGSFGLWNPGYGDLWLDAYVTDFLTRAREKGFKVREKAMLAALENLQNVLSYDQNVKDRGGGIAYALYVLARNRRASAGDLRYYADTKLEEFRSPMARAQLGAALALYGDANRSGTAFQSAFAQARQDKGDLSRSDYGSSLRDASAMLALASETQPLPQSIPAMVDLVSAKASRDRYSTTQENVWMLLAARGVKRADTSMKLAIGGADHAGGYSGTMTGEGLAVVPMEIVNRGQDEVLATVNVLAAPLDALPAGGKGFTIERRYYTLDGVETDVSQVNQNDRFVVVLSIVQQNNWPSRIVVSDLLPGGFEIDSPKLVGSADLKSFEWLGNVSAAHSEFRADRFVAAFDVRKGGNREFTAAYVVRAVSPGKFVHPAAVVEDMYRPQFSARTLQGRLDISPVQP
ncbi:MAG: alpha-2-macroglobulin family protein [Pseudomonadota bacterium]